MSVLGCEGYLPGYGIYDGGISASAEKGFARISGPRTFELSRNQTVALREFVPGNRLYANGGTFYVTRYHLGAEEYAHLESVRVNIEKKLLTAVSDHSSYGQTGTIEMQALPIADLDLTNEGRISEEENLRFAMPVTILGQMLDRHRGGKAYKIGDSEVGHFKGHQIRLVNVGESSRVRNGELGHLICTVCGAAKSPYAVELEKSRFFQYHEEKCGKSLNPVLLSAKTEVDFLQFFNVKNDAEGYNLGESLRVAANQMLEMGENDLEILVVRKADDTLDLRVFDPMPGGSGLIEQILERWIELIETAIELLSECKEKCETSCYSCLRTFRNQFYHDLLNRHEAVEILQKIDVIPNFCMDIPPDYGESTFDEDGPSNAPEAMLVKTLMDHHFPQGKCRERIKIDDDFSTVPDWCFIDENSDVKVAVYVDGMSRGLHGNPKTAQRDKLIRQMLELDGFKVIVVQKNDLTDPEVMYLHLQRIAQAIDREDLM